MAESKPLGDPPDAPPPAAQALEHRDAGDTIDLSLPSLDELWPLPDRTPAADATVADANGATVTSTPRSFLPRPFPVAPPIRPLSFTQEEPVPPASTMPSAAGHAATHQSAPVERETPVAHQERGRSADSRADQFVRLAASRGASALYLWSHSRPSMRIDGELQMLESLPVFTPDQIETLLLSVRLTHGADSREALEAAEVKYTVPEVGDVRCVRVEDHRGPAAVFSIVRRHTTDATTLLPEVEALAAHRDGLVIVAGPKIGKHAVFARLAELAARKQRAYVIAVLREAGDWPLGDNPLVSRRDARGSSDDLLTMARAALRENPNVLVIDEVRSEPLMTLALAAAADALVIAGLAGPTGAAAVERILNLYSPEQGRGVQRALAQSLRAVVSHVSVPAGERGRAVAQEVLPNSAAVAALLSAGKARHLHLAVEAHQRNGASSLNDALLDLVGRGDVRADVAYGHAPDQRAFLEALASRGIDTSSIRLA